MGALMDATARRVSHPREDAARAEWWDGEERGRSTLAFAPAPAPETFKLIASSSPPSTSSSTVVVRVCPRRLLCFRSAVTVSHRPLCLSRSTHQLHRSRSLPSIFPVHHPPPVLASPRQSSPFPVVLAVSLAPLIGFTGPAPFPASSLFIIRLRSSPVIAIPCRPRCLSHSTHRLHRSRSLPSVFPVHHPPPVPLPSQRLPYSSFASSPAPFPASSPFPPLYSPLVHLRSRSLPPVFSHSDESHTSSGYARAAALALSLSLLRTSDYNSPKVPIPGLHLPMIW